MSEDDERAMSVLADLPAVEKLIANYAVDAQHGTRAVDLAGLHLAAFTDRLAEQRAQIPVLDRRAADLGIDAPAFYHHVLPLLFSHQTYKSYPETFVSKGQWDRMSMWLETVSTQSPTTVDVRATTGVDEWIEILAADGHRLYASSGSSGKASFLPFGALDRRRMALFGDVNRSWMLGDAAQRRYPMFFLAPKSGPRVYVDLYWDYAAQLGRPDAVYFLSDRKDSVAEINRFGAIRKAMADGTVRAADLQQFEHETAQRQTEMDDEMNRLADHLAAHQGEPVFIGGSWASALQLINVLKARGVRPGAFPDGSILSVGGGRKAVVMPDDYQAQVDGFFPGRRMRGSYGMSELIQTMPSCSMNRYHVPAGLLFLLLNEAGERVVNPDSGQATGRAAFFDYALTGRWGGVVTSDQVSADFSPCPCGFASTSILSVERISSDSGGDDKLTCAGTMAAYIRGVIGD